MCRPARASQHFLRGKNGVIRFFSHINRLATTSQCFQSGQNLYRSSLALKQASTCFSTSSEVKLALSGLSRAPTSQGHHSGENCFLDLLWHLNRPPRASQHLLGGLNGAIRYFPHINMLALTSHGLHSNENCILGLLWHLNSLPRASQHHIGG